MMQVLECPACGANEDLRLLSTAILTTPIHSVSEGKIMLREAASCDWSNAEPLTRNGKLTLECGSCATQFEAPNSLAVVYDN